MEKYKKVKTNLLGNLINNKIRKYKKHTFHYYKQNNNVGIIEENKDKINNKEKINIKLDNKNSIMRLFAFIIFIIRLSLSFGKIPKLNKLQFASEITLTILGKGDQYILNNKNYTMESIEYSFDQIPDQILVNGEHQNYVGIMVYNLTKEENIITMKFNKLLNSCNIMFLNLTNITKIDLTKFDSSKVTQMAGMFFGCRSLISVNFGNFKTSLVKNMHRMFDSCSKLSSLDLSSFDTSQVEDMYGMFSFCNSMLSFDLNSFTTSKVKEMAVMFYNCTGIKTLSLKSFDTSWVENFHGMFKFCSSLISIDLSSFDTSTANNMNHMFFGCSSLVSLDLSNFSTINIKYLFLMFKDYNINGIFCVNVNKTYKIYQQLMEYNENFTNDCSNACFTKTNHKIIPEKNMCTFDCLNNNDNATFEYENICYENCPADTYAIPSRHICKKILIKDWDINKFFNGSYNTTNLNPELEEEIIDKIKKDIESKEINLTNLIEGDREDLILKNSHTIYQITSTENQKENEYKDISTIQLGQCETILKGIYGIDPKLPLIIFKTDYFVPGIEIPIIGYDIFHPLNKSKLNLEYCKKSIINFNIPVSIDEDKLFKYDPKSEYYTDECYSYTTDNGTDILLNDRHEEYNNDNLSLCENNCSFLEYDKETKKVKCNCEIKTKEYTLPDIINEENILSSYDFKSNSSSLNVFTMKCVYTLFSKDGLSKNIGNYIMLVIVITFIILLILFYKVGYQLIFEEIERIVKSIKVKSHKSGDINNNVIIFTKADKINKKNKKVKSKKKRKNKKSSTISNANSSKKSFSLLDLKGENNININKLKKEHINDYSILNDYELNSLSYEEAINYDKRTFIQYYISLLKTKHPLIFSFFPIKDYNSLIIKVSIFIILFTMIYIFNACFFNDSTIHQIYEDEGVYNFAYFLPKIFGSFVISHILYTLIKYLFLSERNIVEIKKVAKNKDKVSKIKDRISFKYIVFFIITLLLLIFFWYYLSSFCAVFKNSQIYLIKNTLITLSISFIYPFIINILPCAFRIISLGKNNKRREWLYMLSKVFQFI